MINSNFGFTPLKEVWLGDTYPESFYSHLPNQVADALCQITQWCKEDTSKLQKFLESKDIIVQRPQFDSIDDRICHNLTVQKNLYVLDFLQSLMVIYTLVTLVLSV